MSGPGAPSSALSRRQKRMGPAPFASFEDLSDELDSPEDKNAAGSVVRLPGIREDATPSTPRVDQTIEFVYTGISLVGAPASNTPPITTTVSSLSTTTITQESRTSLKMSLQTPNTPRIDISRASSSSQHEDSRESTPERELFDGNNQQAGAKLGLAFKEEGTLDLRSSTEELDFHEPQEKLKVVRKRSQSPGLQDDHTYPRKDSQSSEIGLLSISGRTSRLSSIGSQCSTHSRMSNTSHLSVISGQSTRSPSPHKMLLETSFCGNKSPVNMHHPSEQPGTKVESEALEMVLLSRKHDPREVVLAEGISMEIKKEVKKVEKVKPTESSVTITIEKPRATETVSESESSEKSKLPGIYVSPSGVEYTYIPLKGPIPKDLQKPKLREAKSASATNSRSTTPAQTKPKSATSSPSVQKTPPVVIPPPKGEPQYIRIKLKPDYMYDDKASSTRDVKKPSDLVLEQKPFTQTVSDTSIRSIEPKVSSEALSTSSKSVVKDISTSKSPSPALSRRSSFTSLFKSRETIVSPESPTNPGFRRKNTLTGILKDASENIRERARSRSKSRERDKSSTAPSSTESIDSKTKQPKSVLSIFKPKKTPTKRSNQSSPEVTNNLDGIANVEFKFNAESIKPITKYYETPLHGESIRIPLHSPTHYEERGILQDLKSSSQESQETVIDTTQYVEALVDRAMDDTVQAKPSNKRQSSTSSENVVFSTQLGSNNNLFTTKLPKDKSKNDVQNDVKKEVKRDVENDIAKTVSGEKLCKTVSGEKLSKTFTGEKLSKTPSGEKLSKTPSGEKLSKTPSGEKLSKTPSAEKLPKTLAADKISETKLDKSATLSEIPKSASKEKVHIPKTESLTLNSKPAVVATKSVKNNLMGSITHEDRNSSESEKDSEQDYLKAKEEKMEPIEPERKGLVYQQDSFDDELPYVPTTLPLERSVAMPIVPVKQRCTYEMKTYPIERPRSTTPINLSTLEDYCEDVVGSINTENIAKAIEKLKISLPRDESMERTTKAKSPRKPASATTTWFAFGDKRPREEENEPPPLPPKGVQKEWINFEEIPERRKPPRRIQTIPSRSNIEVPESVVQENVVYNYVNPEDCKCECHELARERDQQTKQDEIRVQEDEVPLLEDDPADEDKSAHEFVNRIKVDLTADRRSLISDSSLDLSTSTDQQHQEIAADPTLRATPFTGDLGLRSNRSSIASQDESQSPDVTTPNAFSKNS